MSIQEHRIDSQELARPAAARVAASRHSFCARQHPRSSVLRRRRLCMLIEPMMEKLIAMRLHGMAEALKAQQQDSSAAELSFIERLAMLVDQQWNWRENQALDRRMKAAKLR